MKIVALSKENDVYTVVNEPGFIGRILGRKVTTKKYKKAPGRTYMFGGNIYHDQDGKQLSNGSSIGEALDEFDNKF